MTKHDTLIFGFHAVRSALRHEPENIDTLWLNPQLPANKKNNLKELCQSQRVRLKHADRDKLDAMAPESNHQGVIATLHQAQSSSFHEQDLPELLAQASATAIILVLDGVTDPHNLGACLRTANAVGALAVIAPKDNAAGLTPTVRKVASGAAEETPFIPVTNLARTLSMLQESGFWAVGTTDKADGNLYHTQLPEKCVLVMGAEGKGMRPNTEKHCDILISLPMRGSVESLNVSVATGVCLYEWHRQHL